MTTGGELVRAQVHDAFVDRYGVRLGNMYGMTEVGVIATDLFGAQPARRAAGPRPGRPRGGRGTARVACRSRRTSGEQDPSRWSDGWLHTRDAGTVDGRTGLVRVLGRRDSQVSVGGLKVDLTEVEHTLAALPEVAGAVVVYENAIEAYLMLADGGDVSAVEREITTRLAGYKRPRRLHVVEQLPRTATGKLVRNHAVLRDIGPNDQHLRPPPGLLRTLANRPPYNPSRKVMPTMIDEIRQFVLDSLVEMNYSIDDVDDDTVLGPAGADLESLALAELAVRAEDQFGVKFDADESEVLAGMTVGEFCRTVESRLQSASTR